MFPVKNNHLYIFIPIFRHYKCFILSCFSFISNIIFWAGTTVNLGPMEMATVFLSPRYDKNNGDKSPDGVDESTVQLPSPQLQNKLRLCFKDFSKK